MTADEEKNRHAADLINCLLDNCSWMNMHIVRPHGNVFEIRKDDGYGARWSVDGTKVYFDSQSLYTFVSSSIMHGVGFPFHFSYPQHLVKEVSHFFCYTRPLLRGQPDIGPFFHLANWLREARQVLGFDTYSDS